MANSHHNRKEFLERRKELRKNLTPAETFLWKHLKAKQLEGRKFHKQHSIDWFIVDFYCPSEKLIIELDGQGHMNPAAHAYDEKRTEHIENLGLKVIRFENKMVFENLPSVLEEIKNNFTRSSL